MKKKTMNELIEELKKDEQVEHWHEIEAKSLHRPHPFLKEWTTG
ncbi:hypothetical protein BsIDN1_38650 [Bacillus safensis]|uniref:Uncharacterized protein n=1 Tax=Bacillus safensis TaxID=561879 RepID=A0A5S9M9S6_BACIA|nr:hypothetical protein BsIDN1_38650 [Bacillus safensis]